MFKFVDGALWEMEFSVDHSVDILPSILLEVHNFIPAFLEGAINHKKILPDLTNLNMFL